MKTLLPSCKRYSLVLVLLLSALLFAKPSVGQIVVLNPTSPWAVPAGVTSIKVECWGRGGSGGGATGSGFLNLANTGGGGGGGGAYSTALLSVSLGQTYTITYGAAGTTGTGNGGAGGATVFTGTGGTVTANGGAGGAANNGAGGLGGSGTFNGGTGGTGVSADGANGGGGAGNAANGNNGSTASNTGTGGAGSPNIAPYIGGAGGGFTTGNTGNAGSATAPGGGGGGARGNSLGNGSGGAGGAGQVVITYTVCVPPAAPSVTSPVNLCQNSTATQLTATGTALLWYTTLTGPPAGTPTAPTPSTITVGNTSFFVSQTVGCESTRSQIVVNVLALPVASVIGHSDINCFAGNDGTITVSASGGTGPYKYAASTDGINFNWITPVPASTNPYQIGSGLEGGLIANQPYRIKVQDSKGCISK